MAEKQRDRKDTDINLTTSGDGTAWDSGRNSSVTEGTRVENELREADAESPGVPGPKPNRDEDR